jgi:hypothetical protein
MLNFSKKTFFEKTKSVLSEIEKLDDIASITDDNNHDGFVIMKLKDWEKIQNLFDLELIKQTREEESISLETYLKNESRA